MVIRTLKTLGFFSTDFIGILFVCLFLVGIIVFTLITIVDRVRYERTKIMSDGELRFYKVLKFAINDKYDVLSQVRLANVVKIRDRYFMWKKFNILGAKCVDFVLIDKQNGETKLVIKLDDKSHKLPERKRRDRFVNKVLRESKIKTLHLPYQRYYKTGEIKEKIMQIIKS